MPQLSRSRVKLCFTKEAVLYPGNPKAAGNMMYFMLVQIKYDKTGFCHILDTKKKKKERPFAFLS